MDFKPRLHLTYPYPRHGALVVVGSGPGIGAHVAAEFARNGFERVVLMSRNKKRLSDDAFTVRSTVPNAKVDIVPVDLGKIEHVEHALKEVDRRLGGMPPECVLFNAARSGTSRLLEWPIEGFQEDLNISVVSLYTVARWAIPQLLALASKDNYKPALLVTSGILCKDPLPHLFSLAACRAAQYNIVTSCYKEFGSRGVHCALIVVGGEIGQNGPISNAQVVANKAWQLYSQEKGKGDLEVEVLGSKGMEEDGTSPSCSHRAWEL